jgi:hypothetical protein
VFIIIISVDPSLLVVDDEMAFLDQHTTAMEAKFAEKDANDDLAARLKPSLQNGSAAEKPATGADLV